MEFAEGLGGVGEGVGDGLVPVHARALSAAFPCALFAQNLRHDQTDHLGEYRRLDHAGFGGALDDRGGLRPRAGEGARDDVEDGAHLETVTAPLEAADGTAAELERAGLVAEEKRDRGGRDEVDGALIAERGAELLAFAQAGAGLAVAGTDPEQARACLRESRELSTALGYQNLSWGATLAFLVGDQTATLELGPIPLT